MPRGFEVSHPLIANMILFVNIINFFESDLFLHNVI